MAEYTLYDGTRLTNIPDGLTDGEAVNLVSQLFPGKAAQRGISYDIEREFDIRSGVPSLQARFGNALTHGNPKEVALEFNNIFGKGNWGVTESGSPWVHPQGLIKAGIQPKDDRKVFLDGVGTDLYDLVDIVPESLYVAAATAADLASFLLPQGRVARGIFGALTSRALSPGLVARNLRAGAGVAAASMGLEGVQQLRNTNTDSIQKIMTTAGIEGGAMTAIGMALGLPFSMIGKMTGGMADAARKAGTAVTMKEGQPLTGQIVAGRVDALRDMLSARGVSEAELTQIMPIATLKERLGDTPTGIGQTAASFAIKLEGRGIKEKEATYVNKTARFVTWMDQYLRGAERAGTPPEVAYRELLKTLTTAEKNQLKKAAANIDDVYTALGVTEGEIGVSQLTQLISDNVARQQKHGIKVFREGTEYYANPVLDAANLNIALPNEQMSVLVSNLSRSLGVQVNQVIPILSQLAGSNTVAKDAVARIGRSIKIEERNGILSVRARKAREAPDEVVGETLAATIKASQANAVVRNYFQKDAKQLLKTFEKEGIEAPAGLRVGLSDPQAATISMLKEAAEADLMATRARLNFTGTTGAGETKIIIGGAEAAPTAAERSTERARNIVRSAEYRWENLLRDAENFIPKKRPLTAPPPAEAVIPASAGDLRELGKTMMTNMYNRKEFNIAALREMTVSHSNLMKSLESTPGLPPKYLTTLKDVNRKYHTFKTPFNIFERSDKRHLTEVTAQNPEQFMTSLLAGKKQRTFEDIYGNLHRLLKGTGDEGWAGVGAGADVATADQLFGTVSNQFLRYQRNEFGLHRLDFENVPVDEIRRRAGRALKKIEDIERIENTASWRVATNRFLATPLMKEYRLALREIAEGNDKGIARLRQHLTFNEAKSLTTRIGALATSMTGNVGGGGALKAFRAEMDQLAQARELARRVSPEMEKQLLAEYGFYFEAETMQTLSSVTAMKFPEANGAYKNWADNFNIINQTQSQRLKELLGESYDGWVGLAATIRAAHNIDPTAGAINAAGIPFTILRKAMHGSFNTAVQPMAFMYAMKEFAPGGILWHGMAKGAGFPVNRATRPGSLLNAEEGAKKFQGAADQAVRKGRKLANAALAGRNGMLAAAIAAYTNEANYTLPMESDIDLIPIKPEMAVDEAETQAIRQQAPAPAPVAAPSADKAANLGQSIIDMITAANAATVKTTENVNIESALAKGREIAAGGP